MSATFLLTESFISKSLTWNYFFKIFRCHNHFKKIINFIIDYKAFELLENKNNLRLSVSIRWMNLKQQIALIDMSLDVAIDLNWLYPERVLENKIINYKYNED